ncbi:hypothetical protein [Ruegeria sp.]|uniref:hypothetical protein n=1 Tax=Ruegeria sp. TaxID=1879320 RepID=UPI003C7B9E16
MNDTEQLQRQPQCGIILLSTLVMLILMVSLIVVTQSLAVGNIKSITRLRQAEQRDLLEDSIRELARPLIAEAMLGFREPHNLKLDGSDYPIRFQGQTVYVSVQNIEGLVSVSKSSEELIRQYLPGDLAETVIAMKHDAQPGLSLRQRFVLAGGDLTEYPDIEFWITDHPEYSRFNSTSTPEYYLQSSAGSSLPQSGSGLQPKAVVLSVR